MRVPFFRPSVSSAALQKLTKVLESGRLSTGPFATELEKRLSEWSGSDHALVVSSCTAALHLALVTQSIGPGDAVLIPSLAFAADFQVVEHCGATAVLVDSSANSLCLDPIQLVAALEHLERSRPQLTPRAVIVVDYGGQMADYQSIKSICKDWNLILIEDAAHALPAAWRSSENSAWVRPGGIADFTCFSFYANKAVTTAEGGALLTRNSKWATSARTFSLHGFARRMPDEPDSAWNREVSAIGFKYNLSDLAAALGLAQFGELESHWKARQRLAEAYIQRLQRFDSLRLPKVLPNREHGWHLFVLRLPCCTDAYKRNQLVQRLLARGIEVSLHWHPLHRHRYVRSRSVTFGAYPISDDAADTMLSLPLYPAMTDDELTYVCNELAGALEPCLSRAASATTRDGALCPASAHLGNKPILAHPTARRH